MLETLAAWLLTMTILLLMVRVCEWAEARRERHNGVDSARLVARI